MGFNCHMPSLQVALSEMQMSVNGSWWHHALQADLRDWLHCTATVVLTELHIRHAWVVLANRLASGNQHVTKPVDPCSTSNSLKPRTYPLGTNQTRFIDAVHAVVR